MPQLREIDELTELKDVMVKVGQESDKMYLAPSERVKIWNKQNFNEN